MAACLGLNVVLGVPVAVEDDDRVGGGQIDPYTPRPRGQEHDEEGGRRLLKLVELLGQTEGGRDGGRGGGREGGLSYSG